MAQASPSFAKAVEHHRAGNLEKAVGLYRHALRTHPRDSRAWQMLGAALYQMGQVEQAEEAVRTAVRCDPPPALGAREGLAMLLARQARHAEAVEVWREGVKSASGSALLAARIRLVQALAEARRSAEALREAERLAADYPDSAAAVYERARLLERMGERDAARAAAVRAIEIDPGAPEPQVLMARLESAAGDHAGARARLERLVETLADARRGGAMMELALVLDRMGQRAQAFEMARRGQQANASSLPPAARDGRVHEQVIDLALALTRGEVDAWPRPEPAAGEKGGGGGVEESDAPVFLVGFPRTGTTLLEQMLAAHPRLAVTDELPILQRVRERMYLRFRPRGVFPTDLGKFSAREVAQARRWYLERARAALGDEALAGADGRPKRLVDKQPLNTLDLCFVRLIFPDSPVLFAARDPRDTVLSCFMQGFTRGSAHLFTLEGTARLYDRLMTVWTHYQQTLGMRMMEVRYERLVREPESVMRGVMEFLGEAWDDRVLHSHESAHRRYVITPSYADVARPVHTGAIGRWRNYAAELEPVMGALAPWVERWGESDAPPR